MWETKIIPWGRIFMEIVFRLGLRQKHKTDFSGRNQRYLPARYSVVFEAFASFV